MKKTITSLACVIVMASASQADNQIKIVGSSTVYPFSSAVAEALGAKGDVPTPVVESTGTGGGMKMFCAGVGEKTPDITNASRKIKPSELATCKQNGVTDITEAPIGYDGIVLAQNKNNPPLKLTRKQIMLAVAAKVPSKDGKSIIDNPYKNWSEIDPSLPNKPIVIYGPPKSSGTRDSFEEMIIQHFTKDGSLKKLYESAGLKNYSKVRTDGVWIDSGENDNLIVQKLIKNPMAIGVFGYSFLDENRNKISSAIVDGVSPTSESISNGSYPISRSMFFYIKNAHRVLKPAIDKYVKLFMSEKMIGERGELKKLGLVPLSKADRAKAINNTISYKKL